MANIISFGLLLVTLAIHLFTYTSDVVAKSLVSKFLIKFSIFVALWVFFDDFYVCLVQEIATISFKNASHETS